MSDTTNKKTLQGADFDELMKRLVKLPPTPKKNIPASKERKNRKSK